MLADALTLRRTESWLTRLRSLGVVLAVAVAAIAGYWLWRQGEVARVWAALAAHPEAVAAALLAYLLAFALRAWAWTRLLGPGRLGPARALAILHAALAANHLLPLRAGDGIRVALARAEGVPLPAALGSTAFSRLLDVVVLGALSVPVWAAGASRAGLPAAAIIPTLALGILAVGAALIARWRGIGERWLPAAPSAVLTVSVATAVAWVLEGGMVLAVASAVEPGFPLWQALAATAFTVGFQLFHATPGGVGLYEASMTGALVAFGTEPGTALAIAVTTHALKYVYALLAGAAAAVQLGWGWQR